MERKFYEDIGYKPFLFYVVFGVSADDLEISRSKHKVDEIPEGLDVVALSRPEHSDYLDGLLGGDIGRVLKNADSDLYETCVKTDKVVILKGEIQKDSTLDYMRNVIGIIQAFMDKGSAGVLDLMTFTLYSPSEWNKRFFEQDEVNAQNHVLIMFSKEDDGYWIHTRGMAEFGRPDYGISNVPDDKLEDYKPDMLRRKSAALSIIDRNTLNNRAMNSGTIAGGSYMDPYYNGLGGNGFVL